MKLTLISAATMLALAAPAFAQQAGQPGSPGIGAGGMQPGSVSQSDQFGNPANGPTDRYLSEGRASAPAFADDPNARARNMQTGPGQY